MHLRFREVKQSLQTLSFRLSTNCPRTFPKAAALFCSTSNVHLCCAQAYMFLRQFISESSSNEKVVPFSSPLFYGWSCNNVTKLFVWNRIKMAAKRNSKNSKDVSLMTLSFLKIDLKRTLIFLCLNSRVIFVRTAVIFFTNIRSQGLTNL